MGFKGPLVVGGFCFKVDDEVLVYNLRRADRKGDKGKQPWDGPYKVAKVI